MPAGGLEMLSESIGSIAQQVRGLENMLEMENADRSHETSISDTGT